MDDDEAMARMRAAVEEACPELVTRFLLVVDAISEDGERTSWIVTHREATPSDVIGLAGYADAKERASIHNGDA